MTSYGFSGDDRIRSSLDFERIYAAGRRQGDRFLLIFAAPNELGRSRIGLSVSRKHGPAVARNRIKRRLREAFRTTKHQLPVGWDLILIPRNSAEATLRDYAKSLKRLSQKLAKAE